MKELVEVIAKSLVDYPDEVNVTETENDKCLHEIWHLSSLFELLRKNTVTLKQFSVTVSSSYVRV